MSHHHEQPADDSRSSENRSAAPTGGPNGTEAGSSQPSGSSQPFGSSQPSGQSHSNPPPRTRRFRPSWFAAGLMISIGAILVLANDSGVGRAIALTALAALGLSLVVGTMGRRIIGGFVVLLSVPLLLATTSMSDDFQLPAVIGSVVVGLGGFLAVVFQPRVPRRVSAAQGQTSKQQWEDLDSGIDPTSR